MPSSSHLLTYESKGQLQDAWAAMLAPGQFDWFVTLTFRRSVGPEAANAAWADWQRWVRRKQGYRAESFRVTERTRAGAIHYHALMGRCSGLRRLSALDYWRHRYGFGQVLRYSPALGAGHYLSKYVCKSADAELDCSISRGLPRLLGRGPLTRPAASSATYSGSSMGASLMPAPSVQDSCQMPGSSTRR